MSQIDNLIKDKDELYNRFKGNDWFKGAGLSRVDKTSYEIMVLIKSGYDNEIPDKWKNWILGRL